MDRDLCTRTACDLNNHAVNKIVTNTVASLVHTYIMDIMFPLETYSTILYLHL